jgi:hypothetical protein
LTAAALGEIRGIAAQVESGIANGPVVPAVSPEEIRTYITSHFDFSKPLPLDEIICRVEQMLSQWQVHVTHPRYFGLFNPSVTFASVVGDLLTAMYNPQLAAWRTAPAATRSNATRFVGSPPNSAFLAIRPRISPAAEWKRISPRSWWR